MGLMAESSGPEGGLLYDFFEQSIDLFCIAGSDGFFKKVNKAFTETLGYSEDELLSVPFITHIHPADIEKTMLEIHRLELGEHTISFQNRYKKSSGEYMWLEWNAMAEENTGLLFASARDITKTKEANDGLLRWKYLYQRSNLAFVIVSPEGLFMDVNEAFTELLGYTNDDLKGKSIASVFMREEQAHIIRCMRKVKNVGSFVFESRQKAIDGLEYDVLVDVNTIYDRGKELYRIANVRDITERKRIERKIKQQNAELKAMNEALDSFVYRVSHDLKSPVVNMISMVNILKREVPSELPFLKEVSARMEHSCQKFQQTINDFLELARIQKLSDVKTEDLNVFSYVQGYIEEFKNTIEEQGAIITVDIDKDASLSYNKAYFQSVVENLLSNALKYQKPLIRSQVHVTHWSNEHSNYFQVKDNGIGIDLKENGEKLFEMFSRLDNHHGVEGTGVGLYSVKKMVEHCGGKIHVESEKGEGSIFTVQLPIKTCSS